MGIVKAIGLSICAGLVTVVAACGGGDDFALDSTPSLTETLMPPPTPIASVPTPTVVSTATPTHIPLDTPTTAPSSPTPTAVTTVTATAIPSATPTPIPSPPIPTAVTTATATPTPPATSTPVPSPPIPTAVATATATPTPLATFTPVPSPTTPTAVTTSTPKADVIFFNGQVVTMDSDMTQTEALSVKDGRILAVGNSSALLEMADSETLIIDLNSRTLMPGLVDSHTHIFNDRSRVGLNAENPPCPSAGSVGGQVPVGWGAIGTLPACYRLRAPQHASGFCHGASWICFG